MTDQIQREEILDCSDLNEVVIRVPEKFTALSLGFVIDSGGSITKILYRSKKDYRNGIRISGESNSEGLLRLRYMPVDDTSKLLIFLEQNCDIMIKDGKENLSSLERRSNPPVFFQSGVGTQHFLTELDKRFHIRTKLMSEEEAKAKSLQRLYFRVPSKSLSDCTESGMAARSTESPQFRPQPVLPAAFTRALQGVRLLISMMAKFKDADSGVSETIPQNADENSSSRAEMELYAMKLLAQDADDLAAEMCLTELNSPCLVVLIGSAVVTHKMDNAGKLQMCDYNPCGGKMIINLAKQLSGAKSFSEVMDLASRGDSNKVNARSGDLRSTDRSETDFYSLMPDEFTVFDMGKLSEERFRGTYSTEDMVAGLLKSYCRLIAKLAVANAKLNSITSVLFGGSFVNNQQLREMIEENFYYEVLLVPFFGGQPIKMGVLEHPGHLCALGLWQHNLDLEEENSPETNQSNEKLSIKSSL